MILEFFGALLIFGIGWRIGRTTQKDEVFALIDRIECMNEIIDAQDIAIDQMRRNITILTVKPRSKKNAAIYPLD